MVSSSSSCARKRRPHRARLRQPPPTCRSSPPATCSSPVRLPSPPSSLPPVARRRYLLSLVLRVHEPPPASAPGCLPPAATTVVHVRSPLRSPLPWSSPSLVSTSDRRDMRRLTARYILSLSLSLPASALPHLRVRLPSTRCRRPRLASP
jgi:hypothetical protein